MLSAPSKSSIRTSTRRAATPPPPPLHHPPQHPPPPNHHTPLHPVRDLPPPPPPNFNLTSIPDARRSQIASIPEDRRHRGRQYYTCNECLVCQTRKGHCDEGPGAGAGSGFGGGAGG